MGLKTLYWDFPLPRTHTGIVLGNGVQGLMIWGDATLNLTVGRAGFWDHRGGHALPARATYPKVRRLLEAGDELGIRALFEMPPADAARAPRPHQLGGGRLELTFSDGFKPYRAAVYPRAAMIKIELRNADNQVAHVRIRQAVDAELAWVTFDLRRCTTVRVRAVPAWQFLQETLARHGVRPPELWRGAHCGGFCQTLPEDAPLAMAWEQHGGQIVIATALGADAAAVARTRAHTADVPAATRTARVWWTRYWQDVPRLNLPDAALQHAYDYGIYKQACLTPPQGIAATLQGPFMEEYQLPPWSNDYHFNINVEMIYWPCLATNRLEHLQPLWNLLRTWLPAMRANGERFFGAPGALMLPHAVDDRGQVVGAFWAGTIDHACTAWMALLAWLHYRHGMDERVLRETAWPLLVGAFNGFWAMLEEVKEGGHRRLSLPVSVSPEYNGSGMDAWGRDASFQLAALHAVVAVMPRAAAVLGEKADPRWRAVREQLPPYTVCAVPQHPGEQRIALWHGQDLAGSHRHHSHLASMYPFCTIEPLDEQHRAIVARSLNHWTAMGPGAWTGWCLPWAATICARCGLVDAAVTWLQFWKNNFTNVGHGTLHNADFPGCTAWDDGALWQPGFQKVQPFPEVMQMDAGMGAVTAILELLVQCCGEEIRVLPRLPKGWHTLAFDGIRTEGAFLVGATVEDGRVVEVRVTSLAGAPLRLRHGLRGAWTVDGQIQRGALLVTPTKKNQALRLRRS
ncbi:MAG: hypothetical protein NTV22_08480 [bacterium]|nr:hypothetical protein [bacterium]